MIWSAEKATIIHPTRGRIGFRPYAYQATFLRDRSPRRLIVKARQIGFSQIFALEAVHTALFESDSTILLVSRNQELAVNLLGYCYNALSSLTGEIPALTKENESEIGFANGSRIKSLPANRSTGRGFAAKHIYLDEYAYQAYAAEIYQSVSPAVGHGGRITVGSTPAGRGNHFAALWFGLEGGDWSRHNVPWWQCPAYNPSTEKPASEEACWALPWYAQERPKYTVAEWGSEYDCDFVTSGQAVFRDADVQACRDGWKGLQPPIAGHRYVTGWDIGRRQDPTVGITLDVTDDEYQVVAFERWLGLPYPEIQRRIDRRTAAYPGTHYVESNSPGDPVIENLTISVTPFYTGPKSKHDMITALALAHENRRFKHGIEQLRNESLVYQWDDKNLVQDCVMAAAIAVFMASKPKWGAFD